VPERVLYWRRNNGGSALGKKQRRMEKLTGGPGCAARCRITAARQGAPNPPGQFRMRANDMARAVPLSEEDEEKL
jgi:hypothetical protein